MSYPFRIGNKVVCLRTTYTNKKFLTKCGKVYEVVDIDRFNSAGIVGDHGFKFIPNWENFKIFNLNEQRKEKLKKLKNESWR